jgi:hypothetical protein
MAGLIFILPILAFDIWLCCTTGWRQLKIWRDQKEWRRIALAAAIGLALAVWFTFFIQYGFGPQIRAKGFPIPLVFFHLADKSWIAEPLPSVLPYIGGATDIITGLAAPFIPYKIAEFLKKVKAELK